MSLLQKHKQSRKDKGEQAVLAMTPEATELLTRLNQQLSFQNWTGAAATVKAIKKNTVAHATFRKMMKDEPAAKRIFKMLGVI